MSRLLKLFTNTAVHTRVQYLHNISKMIIKKSSVKGLNLFEKGLYEESIPYFEKAVGH
jgi:hypothetical protein